MATNKDITGYKLIQTGTLVNFDILETTIDESAGGDEALVRIDLLLGEVEDDQDDLKEGEQPYRTDDHEWGGLSFIFCLATLSFHDARPRGISGDYMTLSHSDHPNSVGNLRT